MSSKVAIVTGGYREPDVGALFSSIYTAHRRLDFVFANAGIPESVFSFYNQHQEQTEETAKSSDSSKDDDNETPPLPLKSLHALVDINLKSVITTTYLADYYMRKSPREADKSMVMISSCGGLYPPYSSPIYTATKHAVVGFMRAVAPHFYQKQGIRVNAICPGTVKTNVASEEQWKMFPEEYSTLLHKVVEVVWMLVEGKDDGMGKLRKEIEGEAFSSVLNGKAVEISGYNHYYKGPVPFSDEQTATIMGYTA